MRQIRRHVPRYVPAWKRRRKLGQRELRRLAHNAAERRERARRQHVLGWKLGGAKKWSLEDTEAKDKRFLLKWSEKMSDLVRADALEERRTISRWIREAIEEKLGTKGLT